MSSCLLPTRAVATIADPNFVKIFLSFRTRDGRWNWKMPPPGAVGVINVLDALCIVMCRRGKGTSPQALRTSFPNLISNRCYPKFPRRRRLGRGRLM